MTRWLLRSVVFLLLGAAANLLIVWGIYRAATPLCWGTVDVVFFPAPQPTHCAMLTRAPGVRLAQSFAFGDVDSFFADSDFEYAATTGAAFPTVQAAVDASPLTGSLPAGWSAEDAAALVQPPEMSAQLTTLLGKFGWPWPAAAMTTCYRRGGIGHHYVQLVPAHYPVDVQPLPTPPQWRVLWPGALGNSAAAAAALFLAWAALRISCAEFMTLSRRGRILFGSLVLGLSLATTTTVAWGLAVSSSSMPLAFVPQAAKRFTLSLPACGEGSEDQGKQYVLIGRRSRAGSEMTACSVPALDEYNTQFLRHNRVLSDRALPAWARTKVPWLLRNQDCWYVAYAHGWPMPALGAEWISPDRTKTDGWISGIQIKPRGGTGNDVLPTRIIWPGFIVNTSLAAALWMALLMGVRWMFFARPRGRLRRGQCPKCGYPAGTGNVCTECGRELPAGLARMIQQAPA